jgi:exosortase/archaeosortase family protein
MMKIKAIAKMKKPIIEYNERKYVFSIKSLIIFAIGGPISAYLVYLFFDLQLNYWLHEIVVKQTVYFLNLFFNMNATVEYNPIGKYHWNFIVPSRGMISFETFCTGVQAIAIFVGVILFTPHSKDKNTRRDIVWRKTKALIISSVIFYVVNIIRMLIQIELYYIGYAWNDIHFSISAASSFIAVIIVLLTHRWIPEFIISIIYVGTLVSEPIKLKRKEKVKEQIQTTNEVDLKTMGKILRMDRKTFSQDIAAWAKDFEYAIEGEYLKVPPEKVPEFIKLLKQDKPFQRTSK